MATLTDVRELVTSELRDRVDDLVSAVEEDDGDFGQIAALADAVAAAADTIAGIYSDIEQTLTNGPTSSGRSERRPRSQPGESESPNEEATKTELLEQARELDVEGRSSMSKDELEQAIEAEESVTKDELLERARQAGIEGRSSMTKDELRKALHDAA